MKHGECEDWCPARLFWFHPRLFLLDSTYKYGSGGTREQILWEFGVYGYEP